MQFEVNRQEFRDTRAVPCPPAELAPGQIRLSVERFALPGPRPEFFFVPSQIAKRSEEWGAAELTKRIAQAWHKLVDDTGRWLSVVHRTGSEEIEAVYRDLLEGQADPAIGYVASMWEQSNCSPVGRMDV